MNIEELKMAIEISKVLDGTTQFPEPVGESVFMRTVTLYYTGKIKKISGGFVTLEKAAWIPDTGRFNDFLKTGKANEVEPFETDVHIPLTSLIDITKWTHKLPQEQQ